MERKLRLSHYFDIQRVRQNGKSFAHPLFVLITLRDEKLDHPLIGVIASKSVGGAVERVRAKRVLRAAADSLLTNIDPKSMVLLIARKRVLEHDANEVCEVLEGQLKKAAIYRSDE